MSQRVCIAIDGPAGAGKSTVAKLVAHRLGLLYIDTGAMYRAVTLKALRRGVDLNDAAALTELARATNIQLIPGVRQTVLLDGEDVTEAIRSPEVTRCVSVVAGVAGVREILVDRQRQMAGETDVIMDGRDIGTVVLPHATAKFFLTASAEERARRRAKEMAEKGYTVDITGLIKEIQERDYRDSHRKVSPLVPAADAVILDSSGMTVDEVVNRIISWLEKNQ
ncbi:(d)CMP kinase [Desulforamulus hydrothermalis]|uniref:Cytidylate kinase n=1 Tax=Desulforamulus hydrothermalis Lam5 = DSM 18033 TaxID=1121428 RepID=K8E0E8_9FIRM|nr:(d)CMP kinase [Desulforamulus hydrothermalis]CCO09017.1 Cytidylate kinase [Desulforamulus hydrothermalis Lam5 = DSM 18033]SHG77026.1 cytidylate kinase [Desulforamulus hydrothermalis Lam5 = DSM 18033]